MSVVRHPPSSYGCWLKKRGGRRKNIKRRWCVISPTDGTLDYFSDDTLYSHLGKIILCEVLDIKEVKNPALAFELHTPTRVWFFQAETPTSHSRFLDALRASTDYCQRSFSVFHEGTLLMRSSKLLIKSWKTTFCMLVPGYLLNFRTSEDAALFKVQARSSLSSSSYSYNQWLTCLYDLSKERLCRGFVQLNGAEVEQCDPNNSLSENKEGIFVLKTISQGEFIFCANTEVNCLKWVESFPSATLLSFRDRSSFSVHNEDGEVVTREHKSASLIHHIHESSSKTVDTLSKELDTAVLGLFSRHVSRCSGEFENLDIDEEETLDNDEESFMRTPLPRVDVTEVLPSVSPISSSNDNSHSPSKFALQNRITDLEKQLRKREEENATLIDSNDELEETKDELLTGNASHIESLKRLQQKIEVLMELIENDSELITTTTGEQVRNYTQSIAESFQHSLTRFLEHSISVAHRDKF